MKMRCPPQALRTRSRNSGRPLQAASNTPAGLIPGPSSAVGLALGWRSHSREQKLWEGDKVTLARNWHDSTAAPLW
ncbi:hypothetical protein AAFF_G00429660 [Aldrovandia affinis]|uniref:Uncharacterized protein n=1 Tax=Aldrovandia affinis TaxID=143900 RepID=A0AAD7S9D7_9TELE|nr:hypothetical protein AAFF_G00429660 [Aldrovandia affinis]